MSCSYKTLLLACVLGSLGLGVLACTQAADNTEMHASVDSASEYRRIDASEAKSMMDAYEGADVVILDVRTPEEFSLGYIPDAVLIPYDELGVRAERELPNKDALILVYCRSGRRSEVAARELLEMGYTRVFDFGGITDWTYEITESDAQ
jgi:rhodanese-related sulfurtransferase